MDVPHKKKISQSSTWALFDLKYVIVVMQL